MPVEKKPQAEPIRGYRLIEPLGAGGFGEVWKCEAPGGIFKAIKFVYGNLDGLHFDSARAEEELRAVQLIKSIRHPFLLSIDRVENIDGELILVTELADQSLQDVLVQHRAGGQPGVPRPELLGYLREAAEVLDLLHQKFDLQHLDIKPRNLFLVGNHVKVADFGLVHSLASSDGRSGGKARIQLGAITPLYAAPELFHGKISRHSDQYSLAIVFQELLTGVLPFRGDNSRQLLLQHTQQAPCLDALPADDRPLLTRALAKDPDQRFASCTDFVRALQAESSLEDTVAVSSSRGLDAAGATTDAPVNETQPVTKAPPASLQPPTFLADYRFLECLGASPLMEAWKVQTPQGKLRMAQVLYGFSSSGGKTLQQAAATLRSFPHPALVRADIAHCDGGRLVLVTDLVKESLLDRFHQCVAKKQPGVVRGELVDYLRAAAEVLDYLYHQHDVQHLGLNPRKLVLDNGWLEIAEFGWAQVLWRHGQDIAARNSRYAAPEFLQGHVHRSCDQYSLAVIYAEMLTGVHPFRGQSRRTHPELDKLPETDRAVVARALNPDPGQRWPSCIDMVLALEGTPLAQAKGLLDKPDHFTAMVQGPKPAFTPPAVAVTHKELKRLIASLRGQESEAGDEAAPPTYTNDGLALVHEFQAGLPLGTGREKIADFAQQWYGAVVHHQDQRFQMDIQLPLQHWWQRFFHRPALQLEIQLKRVNPLLATPIQVTMGVQVRHCAKKHGQRLLEKVGPTLIDSLRQTLLINAEKRTQERLLWPHPLKVIPLYHDGRQDDAIDARGKDISPSGIGFFLPCDLSTPEVLVEVPNTSAEPALTIPATLVRAKRCADGWYEVGALFHLASFNFAGQP